MRITIPLMTSNDTVPWEIVRIQATGLSARIKLKAVVIMVIWHLNERKENSRFHLKVLLHFIMSSVMKKLREKTTQENQITACASTGKNNGFPSLDILGYLKSIHKNPKFGRVRQIPIREFPTKFPNWDLSIVYFFLWSSLVLECQKEKW